MKKFLSLIFLVWPIVVGAATDCPAGAPKAAQTTLSTRMSRDKIIHIINRLWRNVANGRFHKVYNMMTKDYTNLRPDGSILNRKQTIHFFKELQIVEVKDLYNLFLVKGKKTFSAYYIRPERLAGQSEFVNYPVISIFEKDHGTWKWKSEPRWNSLPF